MREPELELEVGRRFGLALDAGDLRRLAKTPRPFEDGLEEVLVHETWFFRDSGVFEHLIDVVRHHPARHLRVLSLPCSSGEEVYSVIIALREAGRDLASFSVTGADLSPRVLALAERGRYGKSSFRGALSERLRDRWLDADGPEWVVPAELRARASFVQDNVVSLGSAPPFDIVLCRNLLVYLSTQGARRAELGVGERVAPGGLLFLGHADRYEHPAFVPSGPPGAFALKKAST